MSAPTPPSISHIAAPDGAAVLSTSTPTPTPAVTWPSTERHNAFAAWLARVARTHHLRPESVRLASADASFRRYLRIDADTDTDTAHTSAHTGAHPHSQGAGASFIIMDAPPDQENCRPFVQVQALMHSAGLRVPDVVAWDEAHGFMLLSDLGTQTVMACLDPTRPQEATQWYSRAIDVLLQWQSASRPEVLPPYDAALLGRELQLFPDWYIAQHRAVPWSDAQQARLALVFQRIVADNLNAPSVFVHRDFMTRNLMAAPPGQPLGVLDFQDAVYGPITYDIASLLRDAFISWDEDFVLDIAVRYWEQARTMGLLGARSASGWGDDFGEFYRALEWMGLQRHLKVAGIFARLTLRDGKDKYLADTPRFIGYIRSTAGRYRELTPLLRLMDHIEGSSAPVGYAFGRV